MRVRMTATQCSENPADPSGYTNGGVGCKVDCQVNHQYPTGKCGKMNPVATYVGEVLDANNQTVNCGCYYDEEGATVRPTTTTTTLPTTATA
jgi:hypothetical protein